MLRCRLPTSINLTVEIPDLFSFPNYIPENVSLSWVAEEFNRAIPELNMAINNGNGVLADGEPYEIQLARHISVLQQFPGETILLARFKLAACMLVLNRSTAVVPTAAPPNVDTLVQYLDALANKTDEVWWYFACANYLKFMQTHTVTRREIDNWLRVIQNMGGVKYKKAIRAWIINHGHKCLSAQDTANLDQLFPDIPYTHNVIAAINRHNVILETSLRNKKYFIEKALIDSLSDVVIIQDEKTLSASSSHIIRISKRMLMVFAGHLYPPSPPMLDFVFPLSTWQKQQFTIAVNKRLRRMKCCNARGFLSKNFCDLKVDVVKQIIISALSDSGIVDSEQKERVWRDKLVGFNIDGISTEFKRMNDLAEKSDSFNYLNSLHLFHNFLIEHDSSRLPVPLLTFIKKIVLNCLNDANQAQFIQDSSLSHSKKHEAFFNLANSIVDSFVTEKQCKIISVGTPIEPEKKWSIHVFYVGIKPIDIHGQPHFKIIVSNAGNGLREFHRPATYGVEADDEEHDYAAFKPMPLNEAAKEFLTNYIYRLLMIRFETATTKCGEKIGNGADRSELTFENIMRHVYLRTNNLKEQSYFDGYKFKRFFHQREDLEVGCLDQIRGNCTVYNLKKLLQVILDLDHVNYGELENTLLLGFDGFIENNPGLKI